LDDYDQSSALNCNNYPFEVAGPQAPAIEHEALINSGKRFISLIFPTSIPDPSDIPFISCSNLSGVNNHVDKYSESKAYHRISVNNAGGNFSIHYKYFGKN